MTFNRGHRRCVVSTLVCLFTMIAPAFAQAEDTDFDRVENGIDNCPLVYNPEQRDTNASGRGDLCGSEVSHPSSSEILSTASSPGPAVLYDIDFGTPPHVVGQIPTIGAGPFPRVTPTDVHNLPTVVSAVGSLIDQPVELSRPRSGGQVESFVLGELFGNNVRYELSFDLFVEALGDDPAVFTTTGFALSWGFDSVNLRFQADGVIRQIGLGTSEVFGTFPIGEKLRVLLIKTGTGTWQLYLNDAFVNEGRQFLPSPDLRFGVQTLSYETRIGVDNIVLETPEQLSRQVVIEDDFESYAIGSSPIAPSIGSWNYTIGEVVPPDGVFSSKSLELGDGLNGRYFNAFPTVRVPELHRFTWKIAVMTPGFVVMGLNIDGAFGVALTYSGGAVQVSDAAGRYVVPEFAYQYGVPQSVEIVADFVLDEYTLEIDGFSVSGLLQRDNPLGFNSVSASTGNARFRIDDLRVEMVDDLPLAPEVDIKPGSDVNPINLKSRGVTPVAILGSDSFDVHDVDTDTLAFGPAGAIGAAPKHKNGGHYEDVNDDGFTDLLSHYRTRESGITADDTEACVAGETFDGTPFESCDSILIVSFCGIGFELALLVPGLIWLRHKRRVI